MHQLVRFVLPLAEMRRDSVTRSIRARFSAHIGVGGEAGRSFKVVQSATAAVCAACHSGTRRLKVLSQFSLLDERARNNEGVLQALSLPECDVEKSIAEMGPLDLVPAA